MSNPSDTDYPDLSDLPPLRDVIAAHELRADKKLGQNFLLDANITDKIARAAQALDLADPDSGFAGVAVFEIGPGPGGLTRSLLRTQADRVVAIEFDPRAVGALQDLQQKSNTRLEIVQGDALTTDLILLAPDQPRAIVANLPYNIATPLLLGWLGQIRTNPNAYKSMTLMFQREVADRIAAAPGSKAYGRLAVMAQWLCHVKKQFDLPPSVFVPAPKVTSSVVRFVPRILPADAPSFSVMEDVVATAFGQRRKMLRSSLKKYAVFLEEAGIDDNLRAEQLKGEDFVRLAQIVQRVRS